MLRNRVRMLQMEEQKAIKKINETKTKTQQILDLKEHNDRQYQQQMMQDRLNQSRLKFNQQLSYEKRQKTTQDHRALKSQVQEQRYHAA